MVTIDDILMLSAAGYTKAEINALATAAAGVPEQDAKPEQKQDASVDIATQLSAISQQLATLTAPKQDAKPEQKPETSVDITAQLSAISQQLTALTAPKPDAKPEQKQTDVLSILQSMNVSAQRYDLPPEYDVEKNLASYFSDMIGGAEKKGDK